MNAGRDVERLIASWLVEEAPGRAPDRILDAAGRVIDRTNQRRIVAEWREPMYVTMRGLVAAAVIGAVLIGGVMFLFKGAPNGEVGATPTPGVSEQASPSSDALAQLQTYRTARNAICAPAMTQLLTIQGALPSGASPAEQADLIDQIIALVTDQTDQLAAIDAPPALAEEHATDVTRHRDGLVLIAEVAALLREGKQTEADAVDRAIGAISSLEESFEQKYSLQPCP
jgi:hypothetical protein